MSNSLKAGLRQQQRSLSQRLEQLEQSYVKALLSINQRFNDHGGQLGELTDKVQALIDLTGPDLVEQRVREIRDERLREQAAGEEAALKQGVADGYVSAVEKVGERSVIVGRYVAPDGSVEEPGRTQLVMPGIQAAFRDKFLGQVVGLNIDLPNGGKFELLEIYDVDEEKAAAFSERQAKETGEAAAQAAEADATATAADEMTAEAERQ